MTIPNQYSATGPHPPPEAAGQEAAHISAMLPEPTLEQIHRRLNAENVDLRGQLELSRKATSAAQELLEAERQKNAALQQQLLTVKHDAAMTRVEWATSKDFVHSDWMKIEQAENAELRLLRVNDAATISDLERRLREAEGQLKAQRVHPGTPVIVSGLQPESQWVRKDWHDEQIAKARREATAMIDSHKAENAELRRTIGLMAKTAAEVQDNFRLIAELAADPANPYGKP